MIEIIIGVSVGVVLLFAVFRTMYKDNKNGNNCTTCDGITGCVCNNKESF